MDVKELSDGTKHVIIPLNRLYGLLHKLIDKAHWAGFTSGISTLEIIPRDSQAVFSSITLNKILITAIQEWDRNHHIGLWGKTALWVDLEAGESWAFLAVILCVLATGQLRHLRLGRCNLHDLPILRALFGDPHHLVWQEEMHWSRSYQVEIFHMFAPKLETLELPTTWSRASTISSPPYPYMVPIGHPNNLPNIRSLALPYWAVIPRPSMNGAYPLPTDKLSASVETINVVVAFPTTYLMEFLNRLIVGTSVKRVSVSFHLEVEGFRIKKFVENVKAKRMQIDKFKEGRLEYVVQV